MATQAQQALEEPRRAIQPGSAGARNVEGTVNANNRTRAIRRRGISMNHSSAPSTPDTADWRGSTGVDNGYGGMGYGPTSPEVDKTMARASPSSMARQVLSTITSPTTVRADGNIWDDPKYGAMANEYGATYALRARNLDRRINSAQQMRELQKKDMADTLDMQDMKLRGLQNEHAIREYGGTGVEPSQPTSYTDSQGRKVFTGQGHQAEMMGKGPPTQEDLQARQQQNERAVAEIKAISQILAAMAGRTYSKEDQATVKELSDRLDQLHAGMTAPTTTQQSADETKESVSFNGTTYKVGDTLPSGKKITKIYADNTVEVQ